MGGQSARHANATPRPRVKPSSMPRRRSSLATALAAPVLTISHSVPGYNKALIFHYFDDKLGLYRALMLRTKQYVFIRFEEAYQRIFEGNDEHVTAERIAALAASYLAALFDLTAEHPEAVRILAWEAAEGWQTFLSCAPSMPAAWSQRVVALLERAQEAGIVRPELDPHLLFTTLVSLPLMHLISLPRFAAMFPDTDFTSPDAIAHAREQITGLVLRGILSPMHHTLNISRRFIAPDDSGAL